MENYLEVHPGFPPNYCWKYDKKNYPDVPSGFPPNYSWKNEKENYPGVPPRSKQNHIAKETVHIFIDGNGSSSEGSMERSKASVVIVTYTKITEGNIAMGNHEKERCTYDMFNILKLKRRIRNLENINAGKVSIIRTK